MSRRSDRSVVYATVAVLLFLVILAVGLRLWQPENTVDDAYITYRYAANLAAGHGLVYNPGEPVLGTSSPAYAIILSAMARFAGPQALPGGSLLLNALLDGALVAGLFLLVRRLCGGGVAGLGAGGAAGMLYAMDAKSVDFSTGGMEAPLFAACVLGCAWLLVRHHVSAAAILAGLSVAVRPDGGLLVVALLLASGLKQRRLPWRQALLAAIPIALCGGLAWLVYGDPLPASLRAKASGVYVLPDDHALRYLCRHLAGMFQPRLPVGRWLPFLSGAAREYATLLATSAVPVALMAAGWRLGRRRGGQGVDFLVIYASLFFVSFAVANPFMMGWYYVPLETVYIALLALGIAAAGSWFHSLGAVWLPAARREMVVGLLLALLLMPQLGRYQWQPAAGRRAATLISEWEKLRERDYLQVGADLQRLTGGQASLAAPEIGALGFAYSGPLLDTVGLVSPVAREFYPVPRDLVAGNIAIPPDLIAAQEPDIVVLLEIFGRKGLLKDPRFLQSYSLWRTYPSRVFGSKGLLVFVRRSAVW